MLDFSNIQYHNKNSDTVVCIFTGWRWSCNSGWALQYFNAIIQQEISCVSFNYQHQDNKESRTMKEDWPKKGKYLVNQTIEFLSSVNLERYKKVIFLWTSSWWVACIKALHNSTVKPYKIIILGFLTGYVHSNDIQHPTTIIQWQYDKYWWIGVVKQELQHTVAPIEYYEIANADHSYYDYQNPSIRYLDQVIQIIKNIIQKTHS